MSKSNRVGAFYINLDRREDRRERFEGCCRRAGIEVERFAAVDGEEIDLPASRDPGDRGVYASLLSHKAVLERARGEGMGAVMVFEDDAVFPEWFRDEVGYFMSLVPADWGLVYLGGHGWPRKWSHVWGPVLRSTNVQNIECYVVRDEVLDDVITALEEAAPVPHRWADEVLRDLQREIPTYTMLNPIVRQYVDYSDNYGREANDYHSRCDVPGSFTDVEGEELIRQVRPFEVPAVAIVGTARGRSASFVAELIHRRGGVLFCVDTWDAEPSMWGDFEWWMNATGLRPWINTIRMEAHRAAAMLVDATFDLVMIDGIDSYETARRTLSTWLPKVRPGGILMGHDYTNLHGPTPGIRKAVDELLGKPSERTESLWIHQR